MGICMSGRFGVLLLGCEDGALVVECRLLSLLEGDVLSKVSSRDGARETRLHAKLSLRSCVKECVLR